MATTINSQSNSESIINLALVSLSTDASAAAAFVLPLGFTPRIVRIHNLTDQISYEWFEGMAALSALKTIAAGTRTLETAAGIQVNPQTNSSSAGNSVLFPAGIMVASKSFAVEALG